MGIELRERLVALAGNTYQPGPRRAELPQGEIMDVASFINEDIYAKCYRPLFVEGEIPQEGFYFSFYPTLRSWIKENHPADWRIITEKIAKLPDKEYKVLGGLLIHAIGPLEDPADLDDLIGMEVKAFEEDFGFAPKGFWPPETAISTPMLHALRKHGYEFVMLRDSQIASAGQNPMFVPVGDGQEMAIFHFDSVLSGKLSYEKWATTNVEQSMEHVFGTSDGIMIGATDTELYGWHGEGKEKWLQGTTAALQSSGYQALGFAPLNIKERLKKAHKERQQHPSEFTTTLRENSSWSCDHGNLGRWTGECDCDHPSPNELRVKQELYRDAHQQNQVINSLLDSVDPKWREKVGDAFVMLRDTVFNGRNFLPQLEQLTKLLYKKRGQRLPNEEVYLLFGAKIYDFISRTSCAWFFPDDERIERDIARFMTRASKYLVEEYQKRQVAPPTLRRVV